MKKTIATLAAVILMVGLMPVAAFAHENSGSGTAATAATYKLCNVKDCNTVGNHKHGGTTYTGHSMKDGHSYHKLCNVNGCTKTSSHKHNGTTCLPHTNNDGHQSHNNGGSHRGGHH